MRRRDLLHLSLAGLLATGCGGARGGGAMRGRSGVLEVAGANGGARFLGAVETAGLAADLSGDGPYTLFVPTDAAFRAAPADALRGDREALRRLVGRHVVPGMVSSAFMEGLEMNHMTSTGDTLAVNGTADPIRVDGARVLRADLPARNGVVHLVDRVLLPG